MDRWTDGLMDGHVDGQTDRRALMAEMDDRQMSRQMYRWPLDKQTVEQTERE